MPMTDASFEDLPLRPNGHLLLSRTNRVTVTVIRLDGEERVIGVPYSCAVCDQRPELQVTDAAVLVTNPCPYPDGITTEITLAVPSGKIIVTDDLRPVYDWDDAEVGDYNTTAGKARAIHAMAAAGCAYGPVGNSCPGLYRTGPDSYIIASPGHDDHDNPLLPEEARLAGICTDLWAYSIADLEHFKTQGGDLDDLGWTATIVDITPGTYRFTHHTGKRGFDHYAPGTVTFAHIQRLT